MDNVIYITGILLAIFAFYQWVTANNDFFKKRGVIYLRPTFFFGNTGGFFFGKYTQYGFIRSLYNEFPTEKIFGFFDWRSPLLFIRDPHVIKKLSVKDFDHFEDHRSFLDEFTDKLFGNSLFMLRGQKWRDMRATLSPAFTGSKMRQMFQLVSECAEDMTSYFIDEANNGKMLNYEMKELFRKYTNDVIASCAFGIKVNSCRDPKNEFFVMGTHATDFTSHRLLSRFLAIKIMPAVTKALDFNFFDSKTINFFSTMVLSNMKVRDEKKIHRPDMINMLMQVRKGTVSDEEDKGHQQLNDEGFSTVHESEIGKMSVQRKWADHELVAQCFLFFVAGFDTSSTLLTFLTYELALNQNIQEKLYHEIYETNQLLGQGQHVEYDVLQKMKYLDQVVSETLRKWPPAAITDRLCVKDYLYTDEKHKFIIPKGTAFWLPICGLHYDPHYFPDPEKFDPERFNDENRNNIVAGSYIPFGIGPRNCIGSRFALMEVKAIIYYILLSFRLEPNEKTQIPIKLKKSPIVNHTESGMHLRFNLRKK